MILTSNVIALWFFTTLLEGRKCCYMVALDNAFNNNCSFTLVYDSVLYI